MPDTLPNIEVQTQLFIDNKFVPAASGKTFDVLNPHDESLLAKVAEGDRADVDRAVSAAQKAFPAWSNMAASARGALIYKLAQAIEEDGENLALIETLDTGHPIRDTRNLDVFRTAAVFRYFAGMADKYEGFVVPAEPGFLTYITRDPIGVVGLIVPWNFPLMFTSWKMGPALAAGNCLVLKPAELTPLTTLRVAELAAKVGLSARGHQYHAGLRRDRRPISRRAWRHRQSVVHRLDRDRPQDRAGLGGQS